MTLDANIDLSKPHALVPAFSDASPSTKLLGLVNTLFCQDS